MLMRREPCTLPSVCCPVALRGDTTATNCDRALISPTYSLDKDTLSQSNTILHESSIANTGLKYSPSSDSSPSLTVSHPLQVPSPLFPPFHPHNILCSSSPSVAATYCCLIVSAKWGFFQSYSSGCHFWTVSATPGFLLPLYC